MASITFRFTTECEITFEGCSHQEAYLQFKDLYQLKKPFNLHKTPSQGKLPHHIYPPSDNVVLFEIDEQDQFNAMTLQGDYSLDILSNLPDNWLRRIGAPSNTTTERGSAPH